MFRSYRTIRVNAPVEWVFQFLYHPETFMTLLPHDASFEYTDVGAKPAGGFYYNMYYSFLRMKVLSVSETLRIVPNQEIVIETKGPLSGLAYWQMEPDGNGTKLTIRFDYRETPQPVYSLSPKLASALTQQMLNTIAENGMQKLRCPDIEANLRQQSVQPSGDSSSGRVM